MARAVHGNADWGAYHYPPVITIRGIAQATGLHSMSRTVDSSIPFEA